MPWWKQPLLHFLVAGSLVFALFEWAGPAGAGSGETLWVTKPAMLEFMQYRNKAFDPDGAEGIWQELSADERKQLIDEYIREEVLYREAVAMKLDRDDYLIRRRLVQKLEFVSEGFSGNAREPDDEALRAFFEKHRDEYRLEPHVTFTHVFFDRDKHGGEGRALAGRQLEVLNRDQVAFSAAVGRGDRFPFLLNYVQRTPEFVAAHFGAAMARVVFDLEPADGLWKGPFESDYGWHLLLLTRRIEGRGLSFAEARGEVLEDWQAETTEAAAEAAVRAIVEKYSVRLAPGLEQPPALEEE